MKIFKALIIVVLVLPVAVTASAKELETVKKAGTNTVIVTFEKAPPVTGDNTVTILIRDASDNAVTDAKVTIDYGMPAMPGMPPMRYKAAAALKDDRYTSVVNFSMPGSWYVNVRFTRGDTTETVKLTVDVR